MRDSPFYLPLHYEGTLGIISEGWSDDHGSVPIQVVRFDECPEPGVSTFATLGMSNYPLKSKKGAHVVQETLISAIGLTDFVEVAKFLLSLAEHVVEAGGPLLRGQVIRFGRPIVQNGPMDSVFISNSSRLDERLLVHEQEGLIFAYAIPVHPSEADYISLHGWSAFEDQLESLDPDIWDLRRPPMM